MDRQHILQEIRRTAEENDGRPLGVRKFLRETGIKESDWKGTFWARWSDAIVEAGLAPNQLTTAYDEAELFEKYIALARELGRLPVPAELRLKAKRDPGFPSENTFERWGGKADLVKRLLDYCTGRDGYQDVLGYCRTYAPRSRPSATKSGSSAEEMGFVYLIKSGRYYKVGRTNAAGRRERELAIQLPEKAQTVHVIRTDDPVGIEAYWHKRFESRHKNGEWFDLTPADVSAFKRRKFM